MSVSVYLIKPSVRNTLLTFRPLACQLLEDAGSRVAADVTMEIGPWAAHKVSTRFAKKNKKNKKLYH